MSKTDKTVSAAAFERQNKVDYWWNAPGTVGGYYTRNRTKGLYCPPAPRRRSRTKRQFVRHYWHSERFKVRRALRGLDTPEPSRTRYSVRWYLDW